jgi:hypothetical protein
MVDLLFRAGFSFFLLALVFVTEFGLLTAAATSFSVNGFFTTSCSATASTDDMIIFARAVEQQSETEKN